MEKYFVADLSKLSANILASLKAIAAGDGKNKNAIDSQQEFNELSKLLANCTNQDDYDCLLGLKISYQTKLENNANSIAKEFYQIADDNSGFSSVEKISALIDKKINANNIVAILDAYQNPEIRHDDSSMIDTITSETGASAAEQRKALTKIINVLCEAAKNAGVSESDITNAKNSFVTSMEKELGAHFRRTNPKDMEKAIDFLKGAILAKQNEVANVDEDTAMQAIAQNYQSQNAQASEDFETARKEEGWTAKTGDWVCGLFGCNTEDELRAKLGDNAQKVEKLITAANSGNKEEFKKVYKELFGIEFDANKIAASEEYQEKYFTAVSMSETNKAIDEILNQNLDYQGTVNALKEKLKYDDETINQIMAQYNQPMETEAEKLALLKQFMTSTKENCAQELKYLTQGESLEQMANKAELLAKAAFGTNDIAKDVTQFNENMVMTEMMTDAAFEIAGTIALQFVPGLGQAAAVKLAASAAKWGARGYKIAQGALKVGKGFRSANRLLTGQRFTSKAAQKGMQIGTQMFNAGAATAAVEFSSGKDMETAVKKIVMNMSFAGVGATSSMIAPKLVQAFGIESQLATEIAEELINAAGSYGVCTAAGDEYGSTDFWTDMATGLIMSRLAHVKGGKSKETTSTEIEKPPVHENDQINHILELDQGMHLISSQETKLLEAFGENFRNFEIDNSGQVRLITQNGKRHCVIKNPDGSIYVEYSQVSSIDGTIIHNKILVDKNGKTTIEKGTTSNSWGSADNDTYNIDLNFETTKEKIIIDKDGNKITETIMPNGVKSIERIDDNGCLCTQIINPDGTIKNIKTITTEDGRTYTLVSKNKINTSEAEEHITTIKLDFDNGSINGGHDIEIYKNIDNIRLEGISSTANVSIIKKGIVNGSDDLPKTIEIRVEEQVNANNISRKKLLFEYQAGPPAYYRTKSKICDSNWKVLEKNGQLLEISGKKPKNLMSHEQIEDILKRMNKTPENCLTYYIQTSANGQEYHVFQYNNKYYIQQIKPDGTLISFYPISKNDLCENYPDVILDKIPIWQ